MASTDTLYTALFRSPTLIERGRDNELVCVVYRDGVIVAPTAAGSSVSIYSRDSTIVDAAAITVTDSKATYTLPAATVADEDLAEGWRVEWTLVIAGETHVMRNDAALVRARLYPVITDLDLYRRHPDLNPSHDASLVPSGTNYQEFLDEAWAELQNALIAKGSRPNLIMTPSSLRAVHLYKVLEMIFLDFSSTSGDGKYDGLADRYAGKAAEAWRDLNFLYDADDSGEADDVRARRSAVGSIWTNGRF